MSPLGSALTGATVRGRTSPRVLGGARGNGGDLTTEGLDAGPVSDRSAVSVDPILVCPQLGAPQLAEVPPRIAGTIAERLLAVLLGSMDDRGNMSLPLARLSAALDTSARQVRRSAGDLVAAGVLVVSQPAQAVGKYSPKVYRLVTRPAGRSGPAGPSGVLSFAGADHVTTRTRRVMR